MLSQYLQIWAEIITGITSIFIIVGFSIWGMVNMLAISAMGFQMMVKGMNSMRKSAIIVILLSNIFWLLLLPLVVMLVRSLG